MGTKNVTLWASVVILPTLWMIGLITGHTWGNLIHVLPVIAVALALSKILQNMARADHDE